MRVTVLRRLMAEEFGQPRAATIAADHVLSSLGGLTADQALAAGVDAKQVWVAVCEAFDVPPERR